MLQHVLDTFVIKPTKTFFMRLRNDPFQSEEDLGEFLQTRSSYIAQVTLFGYLKTRMGTKHRTLFEDEVFAPAIQDAAARLFSTCLADITLYTVARLVRNGGLEPKRGDALAQRLYSKHIRIGLEEFPREELREEIISDGDSRMAGRIKIGNWPDKVDIYGTFRPSEVDIIRFAPVSEEFKEQDKVIVGNSVRLKWNDIRAQLVKRLKEPEFVAILVRA